MHTSETLTLRPFTHIDTIMSTTAIVLGSVAGGIVLLCGGAACVVWGAASFAESVLPFDRRPKTDAQLLEEQQRPWYKTAPMRVGSAVGSCVANLIALGIGIVCLPFCARRYKNGS
jgi:hypothetical protein